MEWGMGEREERERVEEGREKEERGRSGAGVVTVMESKDSKLQLCNRIMKFQLSLSCTSMRVILKVFELPKNMTQHTLEPFSPSLNVPSISTS